MWDSKELGKPRRLAAGIDFPGFSRGLLPHPDCERSFPAPLNHVNPGNAVNVQLWGVYNATVLSASTNLLMCLQLDHPSCYPASIGQHSSTIDGRPRNRMKRTNLNGRKFRPLGVGHSEQVQTRMKGDDTPFP